MAGTPRQAPEPRRVQPPDVTGPRILELDVRARPHRFVVEVDGDTHTDQSRDDRRTEWLEAQGYRVVRVTNADVMMNLDGVLYAIGAAPGAAPLPTLCRMTSGLQ